jgi:hypothetical protein
MTSFEPQERRRDPHGDPSDMVGIVLRAVALAALAISIGIGASLLVDSRHTGYLGVTSAVG